MWSFNFHLNLSQAHSIDQWIDWVTNGWRNSLWQTKLAFLFLQTFLLPNSSVGTHQALEIFGCLSLNCCRTNAANDFWKSFDVYMFLWLIPKDLLPCYDRLTFILIWWLWMNWLTLSGGAKFITIPLTSNKSFPTLQESHDNEKLLTFIRSRDGAPSGWDVPQAVQETSPSNSLDHGGDRGHRIGYAGGHRNSHRYIPAL